MNYPDAGLLHRATGLDVNGPTSVAADSATITLTREQAIDALLSPLTKWEVLKSSLGCAHVFVRLHSDLLSSSQTGEVCEHVADVSLEDFHRIKWRLKVRFGENARNFHGRYANTFNPNCLRVCRGSGGEAASLKIKGDLSDEQRAFMKELLMHVQLPFTDKTGNTSVSYTPQFVEVDGHLAGPKAPIPTFHFFARIKGLGFKNTVSCRAFASDFARADLARWRYWDATNMPAAVDEEEEVHEEEVLEYLNDRVKKEHGFADDQDRFSFKTHEEAKEYLRAGMASQRALPVNAFDDALKKKAVMDDQKMQDKMFAVKSLTKGLGERLFMLEKRKSRGVRGVYDETIHNKMSSVTSLAEGLVENMTILDRQIGRDAPGQRGLEQSPILGELHAQHPRISSEGDGWKARHDYQLRVSEDLMSKYQEVTRAHEGQAARAKEMQIIHMQLQQQVELLTQQNMAHQERIQSLTSQVPVADVAGSVSEMELHTALLQAKVEVQQWQKQHQQAHGNANILQVKYENIMEELQQSQLIGQQASTLHQQAVQEAEMHREEVLLMKTKLMEVESVVAEKQREVDLLSQELRENAQVGKVEPQQEAVGGETLGSVIQEIAALKHELKGSSKSPSLTNSTKHFPVQASTGYPKMAPRTAAYPTVVEMRKSPTTVRSALTVEQANPATAVMAFGSGGVTPKTLKSKVSYNAAATGTKATAPYQFSYPTVAPSQVAANYTQAPRLASGSGGSLRLAMRPMTPV